MATRCITVSTSSPQAPAPAAHPTHTTMGAIAALPENLLREVFSRVGSVRSLFMLAVTSRGWLRRFTDPGFLREMLCPGQLQEGDHRARLLGIFLQDTGFDRMDTAMVKAPRLAQRASSAFASPTFLPAPGSPLGLAGPLASLVADDDGTFNYAEPLAARHGIVLMHLAPRTDAEKDGLLFGMCNPVTGGGRHVLPPLEWSSADPGCVHGFAIVTAADSDLEGTTSAERRFTFSQLLIVTKCDREDFRDYHYLHSYSAASRSWTTHTRCLDTDRYSLVGERSAVVHQGAAHWLCIDDHGLVQRGDAAKCENRLYKLSVKVATGGISFTKLPIRGGGKPLLCVTRDGKLAVASVYYAHVTVWTQPAGAEDGSAAAAAWLRTSFRIPPPAAVDVPLKWRWQPKEEEWCYFGKGSILVLYNSGDVFILDLHSKVMEKAGKVMNCSPSPWVSHGKWKRKRVAYITYEMDLVELFMHQLGGLGRDGLDRSSNPALKLNFSV